MRHTRDEALDRYVGFAIRRWRRGSEISQRRLAELSDVDRNYLSKVERGLHGVSVSTLVKIAWALRLTPAVFLPNLLEVKALRPAPARPSSRKTTSRTRSTSPTR